MDTSTRHRRRNNNDGGSRFDGKDEENDSKRGTAGHRITGTTTRTVMGTGRRTWQKWGAARHRPRTGELLPMTHPAPLRAVDGWWCYRHTGDGRDGMDTSEEEEGDGVLRPHPRQQNPSCLVRGGFDFYLISFMAPHDTEGPNFLLVTLAFAPGGYSLNIYIHHRENPSRGIKSRDTRLRIAFTTTYSDFLQNANASKSIPQAVVHRTERVRPWSSTCLTGRAGQGIPFKFPTHQVDFPWRASESSTKSFTAVMLTRVPHPLEPI
jgi:hypothetical protein